MSVVTAEADTVIGISAVFPFAVSTFTTCRPTFAGIAENVNLSLFMTSTLPLGYVAFTSSPVLSNASVRSSWPEMPVTLYI